RSGSSLRSSRLCVSTTSSISVQSCHSALSTQHFDFSLPPSGPILIPVQPPTRGPARMPKHWIITPPWHGCREAARRHNTAPLIAQLLHSRGIIDCDQAHAFLHPSLRTLYPPEQLPG